MNSNRMSNAFPHCRGKSRQGENRQNLNVFVMLAKVQGVFEYVSVNIPGHVRIYIYIYLDYPADILSFRLFQDF